ncbi:hypothetical protein [Kribbella sp. YM55]|uniref:hypothetical protein n=1 Tax=Kribbella speibonae TaxID=1572660 RepID=UPI00192D4BD3
MLPTVNSYKRLVTGSWSPVSAAWGGDNRTAALRIIAGEESACRMENRLPGADANPYLALAACVADAVHGLEAELELPAAVVGNAYENTDSLLRSSLAEAIVAFAESKLARKVVQGSDRAGSRLLPGMPEPAQLTCRYRVLADVLVGAGAHRRIDGERCDGGGARSR